MTDTAQAQLRFPPLLRWGFRPFFLLGAGWTVLVLVLWLATLSGAIALPTAIDALSWHRHEMLFGFPGAVIAGFLLTAVPNWTGRAPLFGWPLAALVLWWCTARLAVLFSGLAGWLPALLLDAGFFIVLAGYVLRQLVLAGNRNYPVAAICALLGLASGFDLAQAYGGSGTIEAWKAGLALILFLIVLIGGRIIPAFTRNWLAKQGRTDSAPAPFGRVDAIAMAITALALVLWVAVANVVFTSPALALASLLQGVRLVRWRGGQTLADPLVLILHLSYAWLPVGLGLLAVAIAWTGVPQSAALHALGTGAIGSMVLAVMARASLGHTGRPLVAGVAVQAIFALANLGALARVAAPFVPLDYSRLLEFAGLLWGSAFFLFAVVFAKILAAPRPDGKA